jgi:hypothetical protein
MSSGAHVCFRLLPPARVVRNWRAPALALLLIGIFGGLGSRLPLWAQPTSSPSLLINEVHADPNAVEDEAGEWIEIFNASPEAINLQFWSLVNQGNGEHLFPFALWVQPGGYLLLARQDDAAQNGGIKPAYLYHLLNLANQSETLSLRNPEGQIVDSVSWGEGRDLVAHNGASLERSAPDVNAPWTIAHSPWPGSAGDLGSPGAPYSPPPTAIPTPTPPPDTPPLLYLSEIMANPAAVGDDTGEWVEIYNGDSFPINLNGWTLADLDNDRTVLDGDYWLPPGSYAIVALNSDPVQNGGVNVQLSYTGLQLANESDELLLIAPWGVEVDQLSWGSETVKIGEGASLERTVFDPAAAWVTAYAPWSGSAGDLGTPGLPYNALLTPVPTPPPAVTPRLYLSEIMADPAAVTDEMGEWVELYNGDSFAINLNGWILADLGSDRAILNGDFWLQPGGYAVVARGSDSAQNGGVTVQLGYTGMQLANESDELQLITPWGVMVDQLTWGDAGLRVYAGASLERTTFDNTATWERAHTSWAGSAGDSGTPGAPYVYIPATPTLIPTPTASPTVPPTTPTPTPSPTPLPVAWGRRALPSPLVIDQLYPQGSDQEYIVLRNVSGAPVSLDQWRIGDVEYPGDAEGFMLLPASVVLSPGASWVIARHALTFRTVWGRAADAEWSNSDPSLLQLVRDRILGRGELALADDGDELLLFDPEGALADAVAWKEGTYAPLGLTGYLALPSQIALFQAPGAPFPTVTDVRHRFMLLPPNPFSTFALPTLHSHPPVTVDGEMVALWGSLGAASTFSPGGTTPPHVLMAAAGALGLDFLAIADTDRAPTDLVSMAQIDGPIALPAWRWQHPEGDQAIIYSDIMASPLGWGDLFEFLNAQNALAQLPPQVENGIQNAPLFTADNISAPGGLGPLQALWQTVEMPLLPAGNTTPPLPGSSVLAPHYTGLIATHAEPSALIDALGARRGWLTSSPGLWLALYTSSNETGDNEWMGSTIVPANELNLHILYGDSSGESAGLALWQGDHLIRQLDLPPPDGRWQLTIPAAPGSMLYVVATQLDGDFAITAPLYVAPVAGGKLLINEVLPAPGADHNGDGEVNTKDEFIELINSGNAPISLAKYKLSDAATSTGGGSFTFGTDRFIGAGERLLLWRDETGLSLNDAADFIQLFDANGAQVDTLAWENRGYGPSLSRVPDGDDWQQRTPPTPGQPNQAFPPAEPARKPNNDPPPIDPTDVGDPLSPNFGQAPGPPGSLTLAKLRGLQAIVEFRAQVVAPPGLFPSAIYLAEAALDTTGAPLPTAGLGVQVYLRKGEFIAMQEGEWVLVRGGVVKSFRGEMEIEITEPGQVWPFAPGIPLAPLPVTISTIGETLEGRLVSFTGMVTGWQGDSIYLGDPANPDAPSVRVTVRASLGWRRPYVQKGQQFNVVGIVGQFATATPWNDGYRVLVRYEGDLVRVISP